MTVKELIKVLKGVNQSAIVLVSSDSEGNSFSPVDDQISVDYWDGDEPTNDETATPAVILWSTR